MAGPNAKRCRLDTDMNNDSDLVALKAKYSTNCLDRLNRLLRQLCCRDSQFVLEPIRLGPNANAAIPECSYSFSAAFCQMSLIRNSEHIFGSFFIDGVRILKDFLSTETKLPEDDVDRLLLSKLFTYLLDEENQRSLIDMSQNLSEAQVTVVLAQHLLSRLGQSKKYLIDKHSLKGNQACGCPCKADVSDRCRDTSIGHRDVWHGRTDLLLDGQTLVKNIAGVDCDDSPVGKPAEDGQVDVGNTPSTATYSQIVAQTIVFSFLQKRRHPTYSNFLIPSIGVSRNKIVFFFYDCEHDVFLKSVQLDLFVEKLVSPVAIIAIWLVLNHRRFCTGLSEYTDTMPRAGFFEVGKGKLQLYENCLQFGDVGEKHENISLETPLFCRVPKASDNLVRLGF